MLTIYVQFGHASASAGAKGKTGAEVPSSFDYLGEAISKVYNKLVQAGKIVPKPEVSPPPVSMDYNGGRDLGLIWKTLAVFQFQTLLK